jgi:hypothetical protein
MILRSDFHPIFSDVSREGLGVVHKISKKIAWRLRIMNVLGGYVRQTFYEAARR